MRLASLASLVLVACAPSPAPPPQAPAPESSVFPTTLVPPDDPAFRPMYQRLLEVGSPQGVGRVVEEQFQLHGFAVPIVVRQCGAGQHAAFYAPGTGDITICYEILRYANELAGKTGPERYTLDRDALITLVYFTLHEIGHALIDVLDLGLLGDEEDLGDQFAFLIATSTDDQALVRDLIRAPATFLVHHGADMSSKGIPADEHRHGDQRAFAALCMLYGRHRDPVVGEALGADAARCIADAERVVAAWSRALGPYSRRGVFGRPQGGLAPLTQQ